MPVATQPLFNTETLLLFMPPAIMASFLGREMEPIVLVITIIPFSQTILAALTMYPVQEVAQLFLE
jgi:hypothetical protein